MSEELYLQALRVIAEADPGNNSEQSLAHEMALIAKQAVDATQPPLPEAPGEANKVIEWLECEIEAIPTRYHGDPFYDNDAYWMKCEVRDLLKKAADIFSAPKTAGEEG